jgi:DNA-binding transcriptional MocR family regulator
LRDAGVELDEVGAEGAFLWGRVPGMTDSDAYVRRALEAGILLAKGRLFSPSGSYADYLRFNVAYSCDPRLAAFLAGAADKNAAGATGNVRPLRPAAG